MSKKAIEHYEAALKEAFPSGASGDVFHHWNEARKALATQPAPLTDTELINRGCHYKTELMQPAQRKPLTDEQHSLAYWQHEINKARDEAYLQGFAAGKKEAKCSAG